MSNIKQTENLLPEKDSSPNEKKKRGFLFYLGIAAGATLAIPLLPIGLAAFILLSPIVAIGLGIYNYRQYKKKQDRDKYPKMMAIQSVSDEENKRPVAITEDSITADLKSTWDEKVKATFEEAREARASTTSIPVDAQPKTEDERKEANESYKQDAQEIYSNLDAWKDRIRGEVVKSQAVSDLRVPVQSIIGGDETVQGKEEVKVVEKDDQSETVSFNLSGKEKEKEKEVEREETHQTPVSELEDFDKEIEKLNSEIEVLKDDEPETVQWKKAVPDKEVERITHYQTPVSELEKIEKKLMELKEDKEHARREYKDIHAKLKEVEKKYADELVELDKLADSDENTSTLFLLNKRERLVAEKDKEIGELHSKARQLISDVVKIKDDRENLIERGRELNTPIEPIQPQQQEEPTIQAQRKEPTEIQTQEPVIDAAAKRRKALEEARERLARLHAKLLEKQPEVAQWKKVAPRSATSAASVRKTTKERFARRGDRKEIIEQQPRKLGLPFFDEKKNEWYKLKREENPSQESPNPENKGGKPSKKKRP